MKTATTPPFLCNLGFGHGAAFLKGLTWYYYILVVYLSVNNNIGYIADNTLFEIKGILLKYVNLCGGNPMPAVSIKNLRK